MYRQASSLIIATTLCVLGASTPAQAADSGDQSDGRPVGHGHGMSQYGARSAAAEGVAAEEILDFYYPGTAPGTMADGVVAVWLQADNDDDLTVAATDGLTLVDGSGAAFPLNHPAGPASMWRVTRRADGELGIAGQVGGQWRDVGTSRPLTLPVRFYSPSSVVTLVLPTGSRTSYRGELRAVADGTGLKTVNAVNLEDYLRSVVPAEMPPSWPAEALRAQAIAARSYAAYEIRAHSGDAWHICDSDQCQVYAGIGSETASSDAAVAQTVAQVRTYQGAVAFTQFSATNGGHTVAGDKPYLVAVEDPWDGLTKPDEPETTITPPWRSRPAFDLRQLFLTDE